MMKLNHVSPVDPETFFANPWREALSQISWSKFDHNFNFNMNFPPNPTSKWETTLPSPQSETLRLHVEGKGLYFDSNSVPFVIRLNQDFIAKNPGSDLSSYITAKAGGTVNKLSLTLNGKRLIPDIPLKDAPFGTALDGSKGLLQVIIEDLHDDEKDIGEPTINYALRFLHLNVKSRSTARLKLNQLNLNLIGKRSINGLGNKHDNIINGNSAANKLLGFAGHDKLNGKAENDTIVGHNGNDVLIGGAGNDTMDGGGGNDRMNGGPGDDILIGGLGKDRMNGGGGKNIFKYFSINESRVDAEDIIFGFRGNRGDKIDLSLIDANGDTPEKETFKFIGKKQFTGQAGEIRFDEGILRVNTGSDFDQIMAIVLRGVNNFNADFLIL